MIKFAFVIALSVFSGAFAAKKVCPLERLIDDSLEVMGSRRQLKIQTKKGSGLVTYSHDTELDVPDWLTFIFSDRTATKKLDDLVGPLSPSLVATHLNMTSEDLQDDAAREGVELGREIKLSDLEPEYAVDAFLWEVADRQDTGKPAIDAAKIAEILSPIMTKRKLPVTVGEDGGAIEIQHKSFEKTPAGAKKFLKWIFATFESPNPHLHIGLPTAAIFRDQTLRIARAIETLVVLDRATSRSEDLSALPYDYGSPLMNVLDRGVVNINYSQFRGPQGTQDDIEIRQYRDERQGLLLMGLASKLAQNVDFMPHDKEYAYARIKSSRDIKYGNLMGALLYAQELFQTRGNSKSSKIASSLKRFRNKMEDSKKYSPSDLEALRKFLRDEKIIDQLSDWTLYTRPK